MDSPGVGRARPKCSSLPLIFERQILTLGPKVTCVLFLTIFRLSTVFELWQKSFTLIFRCGFMLLVREVIRYFEGAISKVTLCDGGL